MSRKQLEMTILLQDLVLAFVINTGATILNGGFTTAPLYIIGMFEAFCINYIAGLIIPVAKIGNAVAGGIGLKESSFLHKLVRIFVVNAIFVTIISFTIALINVGPTTAVFGIWWSTYPALHLIGLVTSVLIEAPCQDLAQALLQK